MELELLSALRAPGVELLALLFVAAGDQDAERLTALAEAHRAHGLKTIAVVLPRDDSDRRLQRAFAVDRTPAAFMWSWRGDLLVGRGALADLEREAAAYEKRRLRIDVEITALAEESYITAETLSSLVRGRLRLEGKTAVVATRAERGKLTELKRRSYEPRFDDALQAELGRDLSANALLEVSIRDALPRSMLELELFSIETSALLAASAVEWRPLAPNETVAEAIGRLLARMIREPEAPKLSRAADLEDYDLAERTDPAGAVAAALEDPSVAFVAMFPPLEPTGTATTPGVRVLEGLFGDGAFLWSWRGELLVDRKPRAAVAAALAASAPPRLHIAAEPKLAEDLRALISRTARFELAGADEPANVLLEVTGRELRLLSIDRADLIASAVLAEGSAAAALDALFSSMKRPLQLPAATPRAAELETAWQGLYPFVIDGANDRARRIAVLRKFLREFASPNHRRAEAEAMLQAIEEN